LVSAALFEELAGATWAGVVSAELFRQFLIAMDDLFTAFDLSFGGVAFAAFTCDLESRVRLR
jgi:hypothetical protein